MVQNLNLDISQKFMQWIKISFFINKKVINLKFKYFNEKKN